MGRWIAALGLVVGLAATPANAQLPEGTLEVKSERISTDGKLFACYLQFEALMRDRVYRKGLFSLVGGSLGYTRNGTMLLKVALQDFDADLKPVPTGRPGSAYVETAARANNSEGSRRARLRRLRWSHVCLRHRRCDARDP